MRDRTLTSGKKRSCLAGIAGFLLLFATDQLSKAAVRSFLAPRGELPLIKGVFSLYYLENRGAAFGMLKNRQYAFVAVAAAMIAALVWFYLRLPDEKRYTALKACLTMTAAGAAGNLADRVFSGFVTDFLYFRLIDFPVFNLADVFICVGLGITILLMLTRYRKDELF